MLLPRVCKVYGRGVSRIFQKGFPSIDNQWVRLYGMLHLGGFGGMPPPRKILKIGYQIIESGVTLH